MRKVVKRFLLAMLTIAVLLAIAAWVTLTWIITRPASYQPALQVGPILLRSWPEHDAIYQQTDFPYVLSIDTNTGSLEYVGVCHTLDATDPQLSEIERRWDKFQPTVALCEGRGRMFRFASRPQTGKLSESDLTRVLANQNAVPLFTLEPTYKAEVAGLLKHFEPELVATYMTLRVYSAEAGQPQKNQDGLALHLLRKRTDVDGLRNTFATIVELDDYWQEKFPNEPDWRFLSGTENIPLLAEVGNVSRQVRGQHMVRTLVELVGKGERVFAVVGASHVIRQELVLRKLLESDD